MAIPFRSVCFFMQLQIWLYEKWGNIKWWTHNGRCDVACWVGKLELELKLACNPFIAASRSCLYFTYLVSIKSFLVMEAVSWEVFCGRLHLRRRKSVRFYYFLWSLFYEITLLKTLIKHQKHSRFPNWVMPLKKIQKAMQLSN